MGFNKVIISNAAKKEIDEALRYISFELSNPKAANDLYLKLLDVFDMISRFPESYPLVSYFLATYTNTRKAPVNNYTVIYRYFRTTKTIIILRFLSCRRNFDDLYASIEW